MAHPSAHSAGISAPWWTYAYTGKRRGLNWYDFRRKYMELGGDGIRRLKVNYLSPPCGENLEPDLQEGLSCIRILATETPAV